MKKRQVGCKQVIDFMKKGSHFRYIDLKYKTVKSK